MTLFPADYEMPRQRYANDDVDEGSVVDQLTRRLNCLRVGRGGGGVHGRHMGMAVVDDTPMIWTASV